MVTCARIIAGAPGVTYIASTTRSVGIPATGLSVGRARGAAEGDGIVRLSRLGGAGHTAAIPVAAVEDIDVQVAVHIRDFNCDIACHLTGECVDILRARLGEIIANKLRRELLI